MTKEKDTVKKRQVFYTIEGATSALQLELSGVLKLPGKVYAAVDLGTCFILALQLSKF